MSDRTKQPRKIIITVSHDGACQILSPPEVQIEEVMDILTAALDAAFTKAEEEQAHRAQLNATLDALLKKPEYKN